jgi:predicted DNA-binding ribbon-helix-helix protein
MTKFVQSLDPEIYKSLEALAKARGITVQALIRQVIGEWLINQKKG